MKIAKKLGYTLLKAAVLYFIFSFANFTMAQSILLALLVVVLYESINSHEVKLEARFVPYALLIQPNWVNILVDFKLAKDLAAVQKMFQKIKKDTTSPQPLLEDFYYNVIQNTMTGHQLIYDTVTKRFSSTISYYGKLDPIEIKRNEDERTVFRNEEYSVYFTVNQTNKNSGGIVIKLGVPERWYNENKSNLPKVIDAQNDPTTGYYDLEIAHIPFSEFMVYWANVDYPGDLEKVIDTMRKQYGWTQKERGEYDSYDGVTLLSKYFKVIHNPL